MDQYFYQNKVKKLFSPQMLLLCIVGMIINIILSKLVILFDIPLYIDCAGSIIVAALGGVLPAMAVGFLSNLLGSITEPISLYYGVLSVLIAWLTAIFSQNGLLKKVKGWLMASAVFVLIGGGVGSVMTWLLYGGQISGIAAPYANILHEHGMAPFISQLTADILVDIPDKLITVGVACLFLRFYPKSLYDKFPLSYIYEKNVESITVQAENKLNYKISVNKRIVTLLVVCAATISVMAVAIGTLYHHKRLLQSYETVATVVAQQAAACVDGNKIENYLEDGGNEPDYLRTKQELYDIFNNTENVCFLYVYEVKEDGCHVVFDLDTPELKARKAGTILKDEQGFSDRLDKFISGENIQPGFTKGSYGSFMTAYIPVYDGEDKVAAYACADVDMNDYAKDLMTYIIQVLSVLFGISLIIITFALWFVNNKITTPIRMIVDQTKELGKISPQNWLDSEAWKNRVPVKTGDELEELYNTVCKVEENTSRNVLKVIETEHKLMQSQELEKMNKELENAIRKADEANQAKTDFLSRMSHDIRTPLNAILGTANLAKDDINNSDIMKESLDTIESSGIFLLGLINDILDINKIESGKIDLRPETYHIEEFSSTMKNTFVPLMDKKKLNFTFVSPEGFNAIRVDKLRYNQIFFNILSNAVKYTKEGGSVEFTIDRHEAPKGMAGLRHTIKDTGIGMSKEYMSKMFEPFTRDSNAEINRTEGSGLGLAIVKNIIDAMGGNIEVHSELGRGSEFIVDLIVPLVEGENELVVDINKVDDSILEGKNILLVEDNNINITIAKKILEKKKCIVTVAENGRIAVDKFNDSKVNTFDAILMDIRMPVMDGIRATQLIRNSNRTDAYLIPIIAMTADAFSDDISKTKEAGMNAHLAKPIDSTLLYQTIAKELIQKGDNNV